ncbi:hypothetical protein N8666_00420 [bacterium]|nr:hypothetical protein [bacterium]
MYVKKINILQVGPISYVGGVSIHIFRLAEMLKNNFIFEYIDDSPTNISKGDFINIRNFRDFFKILKLIHSSNLIHIHSGNWIIRLYVSFLAILLRKNFIVTLHSYRISTIKSFITLFFLKKSQSIIAVSGEIKKLIPNKLINKVLIKEAFLPPFSELNNILNKEVLEIVNKYQKNSTLICANAYRLIKYNNSELYGLDQCIDVAKLAKENKKKLHIIFVIGTIKDEDRVFYNEFINSVNFHKLESYISIINEGISFVNLILKCDAVLRPTLSDGDALTIREALWFNKKVIASDVVKRPDKTILYKTGNSVDLYSKIINLKKEKSLKYNNKKLNTNLNHNFYKQLYIK